MMTRRPFPVTLALVFLAIMTVTATAEPYMDIARVERILEAQDSLFNDRFDAVDSAYRAYIDARPNDPAGYIFLAGALMAEMSDCEENLYGDQFRELLDTAETLADRVLDTCDNPTRAWMYLFLGHAKAYRSLYEVRFGSSLSALKLGLATIDQYEEGRKADSTLYDLDAGAGSYHYWKSAKAGVLKYLGIFRDEKDKGIAELHRAADSSLLHRELARSALIWIWLDRREYDSAFVLAEAFVRRYPDGKTFRWPLAQAAFRLGRYQEAARVYDEIRAKLEADPGNYYNLIQCDYHITQCYNWMSDPDRTGAAAGRIHEYFDRVPSKTIKRQRSKIDFLMRVARR